MIGYDGLGTYYQMSIKNGPFAELSRPAPPHVSSFKALHSSIVVIGISTLL